MKQLSKRVSAALPAVLMGLSLLPQTVLALDPDQRQAERRDGYDVATVHYTDAKGDEQAIPFTETGSGYVYTLPQGVTEDKATVEYFSTTRWDGAVDISWYNDTDREFTLTNPAQLAGLAKLVKENVTFEGKTIRLGADIYLLRYEETGKPWWDGIGITTSSTAVFKGTFDGCFILRSGKYPELEMAADLVGSDPVLTVVLKDSHGSVTGEQSFTARQLSGLSQTGAVGYQYWKKDTENLVAATKYVTLETLLKAAGADFTPGMTVTAADAAGYSGTLGYRDYQTCRWYIDGSGVKSDAPAALALCWNSGEGTVDEVAAGAVDTGSIRFCYSISEDQYGSAAGKRLVSGVVTVTVQTCVHDGESQDVPGTPVTCTQPGVTAGVKCTVCGAEDPDYQPEQPTQPENPGVKTGDESYVVLWSGAQLCC